MAIFGWASGEPEPPGRWDLRRHGWTLCADEDQAREPCGHVVLIEAHSLDPVQRMAAAVPHAILIGVEDGGERARLIERACGDAVPGAIDLPELEARARRIAAMLAMLPRRRAVGPLTLDLFHRDARRGPKWLGLHPREFELLWRLADQPGQASSRRALLRDVWRIAQEPETNSVEVHVSRLRVKLAAAGCARLIETVPQGGYRLAALEPALQATAGP